MTKQPAKKIRGVYEHPADSNIWWVQWFDASGIRHREKAGTKAAAIKLKTKRTTDKLEERKIPATLKYKVDVTFSELCDDAETEGKAENGESAYKNLCTITKALRPDFGDRKASSITSDELKKWLRAQDAKRDWADGTYNGYITQLCVIFGLGIKHKKISENPAKEIKLRTLHNDKPRYLSPDEANRFETTIKELFPQHWEAFQFARFIGFRASAQFNLKWTQVDLQQRKISLPPIRRSKYKKWRDFPMNSIVYTIILDRWNRTSDHRGYVFAEYHQGPEYLSKPAYWFPEIVEAAGVEDFTWHSLRHDFISQLVMKGVNLKTVMDLAGHANLKQTAKYAALAPTTLAESSELLTTATVTAPTPNPDHVSGNEVPPKLPLAVLA